MVVAEIATGYGALKSAYEIARGLKDINDRVALNAAVIDLQEKILSAQEASANARDELRQLSERLAGYERWEATAALYALKDFGDMTFAYESRPVAGGDNPKHLACPSCFQKRSLSILQFKGIYSGRRRFICNTCDKQVDLGRLEYSQGGVIGADYNPFDP